MVGCCANRVRSSGGGTCNSLVFLAIIPARRFEIDTGTFVNCSGEGCVGDIVRSDPPRDPPLRLTDGVLSYSLKVAAAL
jgi:hypothetical protein